jgi:hypothetical protein
MHTVSKYVLRYFAQHNVKIFSCCKYAYDSYKCTEDTANQQWGNCTVDLRPIADEASE